MLLETGRAEPHRAGVNGWVSVDLDDATELFRLSYERARVAESVRGSREQAGEAVDPDVPAGDDHPDAPS